jgi:hypothetical protein
MLASASKVIAKLLISLVPGERFELPTNGLQNRCSTTELTRHFLLYYKTLSPFPVWQNRLICA